YTTQFQKIVGPYFIDVMNKEFHWNLFFIMLFEIEPQDNVGDFEKFIGFLEQAYQSSPSVTRLKKVLYSQLEEHSDDIMEQIMVTLANSIIATDDIECIYEDSISDVTSVMIDVLRDITSQITTIDQWRDQQDVLLTELSDRFNEALE
ncbi:(p)ppGpp synthetase, partial [Turicibacter sanguinis]